MEYVKNLFSLNILGIQAKLQIKNILYVNDGVSAVKIVLQLAFHYIKKNKYQYAFSYKKL